MGLLEGSIKETVKNASAKNQNRTVSSLNSSFLPNLRTWGSFIMSHRKDPDSLRPYHSDTSLAYLGGDYILTNKWSLGLSYGYSESSIKTFYNSGRIKLHNHIIAPYINFSMNDCITFQLLGGQSLGNLDIKQKYNNSEVKGNTKSSNRYGALSTYFYKKINRFMPSLCVTYLYYDEKTKGFFLSDGTHTTESRAYKGNLNFSLRLSYNLFGNMKSYLEGGPQWDTNYSSKKTEIGYTLGGAFFFIFKKVKIQYGL